MNKKQLARNMLDKTATAPESKYRAAVAVFVVFLVIGFAAVIWFIWQKHADSEVKRQQAVVLTHQQAQDKDVLINELAINKQNAELLANFISKAQLGRAQSIKNFTIRAQNLPQAAEQLTDRIKDKDPTLPLSVLEKTDNTIVTANVNKTAKTPYDVAVFKNNNYRNWEWSVGYGFQQGSKYMTIGLQRNYSKDKAIEAEVHLDPSEIKKVTGGEIKQVWKTDKLFGVF